MGPVDDVVRDARGLAADRQRRGRTAALAGSFFEGGATNTTPLYGEMGGSINLTGTNYLGSGIFVARKP
jgi:hypothetical protein